MAAKFDVTKMYSYLKGYCFAKNWQDAISALSFARNAHKEQVRKGGQPYIIHPLTMACHATALQIDDEDVIVACLLHDVVEDCDVTLKELPITSERARAAVNHLTHPDGTPLETYYKMIQGDDVASIVKVLDRCDNVSTMSGVFSKEKTRDYIYETRQFVLPLLRDTKNRFPNYSNALFVLKYHIMSVIDGLEALLDAHDD